MKATCLSVYKQHNFDLKITVGWAEKDMDLGGVQVGMNTLKIHCTKFSRY